MIVTFFLFFVIVVGIQFWWIVLSYVCIGFFLWICKNLFPHSFVCVCFIKRRIIEFFWCIHICICVCVCVYLAVDTYLMWVLCIVVIIRRMYRIFMMIRGKKWGSSNDLFYMMHTLFNFIHDGSVTRISHTFFSILVFDFSHFDLILIFY